MNHSIIVIDVGRGRVREAAVGQQRTGINSGINLSACESYSEQGAVPEDAEK